MKRFKVVFEIDGEEKETTFNGFDEKEKSRIFKEEYVKKGYNNVRIIEYEKD